MVQIRRASAALLSACALVLAVPPLASAADPVPGATYTGTTEIGNTFTLVVSADGTAVVEAVFSAPVTCVGPDGGVEIRSAVTKTPFPISGGTFSGKDEATDPRFDRFSGTFTTPTTVSGEYEIADSQFVPGEGVKSCRREGTFTATTSAAPPAGAPGTPGAPAPTAGAPAPGAAPAVTLDVPRAPRLGTLRASGVRAAGRLAGPGTVAASLVLRAADARRLGLRRRTIATGTRRLAAAGPYALTLKPSAATARMVRRARRLVVTLRVESRGTTGAPVVRTRTLTLRR